MTTRQLLVWPEGADLEPVKRAFLSLNAPFQVSPHWFQPGKHSGRVLVLADGFDWVHDHIYPKADSVLPAALEWCLGMRDLEQGPHTVESILEGAFGAPVVEVFE